MKKKKTYAAVMLVAGLLSLLGCVPAFADAEGFSEEYSRFQDPDGILSGDEAEELNEKLDEISHDQEFDVTAALVNSLGGSSVQDYADTFPHLGMELQHSQTQASSTLENRSNQIWQTETIWTHLKPMQISVIIPLTRQTAENLTM